MADIQETPVTEIPADMPETEVILATAATSEGDMTALYIERVLSPLKNGNPKLKLTRLGRGLSAGSELEYADDQTLRNALKNRG